MTEEKLKAEHPEVYASVVAVGVARKDAEITAEKLEIEAKRVAKETMRAEILAEIEANKLNPLESLTAENAAPVVAAPVVTAELTDLEKISAKIDAELGLIK